MSVMKAALPDEDLMLASPAPGLASTAGGGGAAALAAAAAGGAAAHAAALQQAVAKLPPGSLQLPTTFELLVGDRPLSPSASPQLPQVRAPGGQGHRVALGWPEFLLGLPRGCRRVAQGLPGRLLCWIRFC
jgi:hypothetical protein